MVTGCDELLEFWHRIDLSFCIYYLRELGYGMARDIKTLINLHEPLNMISLPRLFFVFNIIDCLYIGFGVSTWSFTL